MRISPLGMTQRQVAQALGISRTYLRFLERVAIAKLTIGLGASAKPLPRWMLQYEPPRTGVRKRCGRCGEMGHNRLGCVWGRP